MRKIIRISCLALAGLFLFVTVPAEASQTGNAALDQLIDTIGGLNQDDSAGTVSPKEEIPNENDAENTVSGTDSEKEPNDDISSANVIQVGKPMVGSTRSEGEVDIFKFTLKKAAYVNISMEYLSTNTGGNLWFAYIRDSKGKVVNQTTDNLFAADNGTYAQSGQVKLKKGVYYVTVVGYALSYGRNYTLRVNKIQALTPELDVVAASGYRAVDVSWKPVPGAYAYYVYRSTTKKGNYKKVGTCKGTINTFWTDKNVQTGKTYYYKVKTVVKTSKTITGNASKAGAAKPLPEKPYVLPEAGDGRIDLYWFRVEGANGYEIYRSTAESGAYKKVKTIKKGTSTAYTDTKVKKETNYYYKVRAYCNVKGKKVYSDYSAVVSARPEA